MALPVPTSPDVCFCTTWGKQNKRNMHWHEQQTSTNWRLDRIKIWSRQSELLRYIIYLLTAVFPAIKCVAGDTFVFQQDSAPAHQLAKRSNCWSAKPLSGSVVPNGLDRLIRSSGESCNSRSIRRRSRMWMNLRSNRLKSGLVWSRTLLTLLSTHGENVCVLVFAQRADISNTDCSSWTTGHLDKLSARVTEMYTKRDLRVLF